MHRSIRLVAFAMLTSFATSSLRAEDLSRWIWVSQSPATNASTTQTPGDDRLGETIATPRQQSLECPDLAQWGYEKKPLSELSLDAKIRDQRVPADCSTSVFQGTTVGDDARSWLATDFNWAASDLHAQPAYFDDPVLERYGQTRHPLVQPWLSGAHFFSQFPLMPYKIVTDRPYNTLYTLGYQRPGSPMPSTALRWLK